MTPGSHRMDGTFARLLDRRETQGRRRRLTLPPPGAVDFSSNSYLSLSESPELRTRYLALLQHDGGDHRFSLGSGGSRLLDGNTALAEALEERVAAFHGAPAGLLFNSGFDANAGLLGCAPQPGDVVVYDELVHASVHDGMRLGRAAHRALPFTHNTVAGSGGNSLSAVLERLCSGPDGDDFRRGRRNVFVAVEGVYSMDGDVAPLREIVACVGEKLPQGNGHVIVDEAHSTGIIGQRGRGLVCHLGLQDQVWARVHTFGKAMGCAGAIVLCSPTTRSYLINYARSFIYTTALGYPSLAAIQTTYEHLAGGFADGRLGSLRALIRRAHGNLAGLCRRHAVPSHILRINAAVPESPIFPLFTASARELAAHCQRHGFLLRAIVAPTVPRGTDRVRLCLHAGNTADEVDGLCRVIEKWACDKMGMESPVVQEVEEASIVKSEISRL
ncbi:Pyridoxal phosphate-dependent transferase, major domain protein [Cordyceps fumosorosea ARSEF 2679]|uniref:Pyridoxal phosphate-dependent transferase, major domain protein n=1 Tax=Cordyceps fumosorosea (strain ARSEF 2679) TaxID=1081104 RepID=A0A162J356_CORFA|nr:Pyridoxal phosphate-dependent transferase, major domain protein [Cordyceps fumosorosea ARSEF 2679]OAA63122.1 Pyridoxal phosphate-dependent transferase, major domain protein [Cordyceps fumosorosea ARSEF 2679]